MAVNYDKLHQRNLEKYSKQIRRAYLDAIKQFKKIIQTSPSLTGQEIFQNPAMKKKVGKLMDGMFNQVEGFTISGMNTEWDLAVEKNNELAKKYFGKSWDKLPKDLKNRYLQPNYEARKKFVERKINGLGLSDRVWRNTEQFKQELELALEYGIGKGHSAGYIAKNIQQYLNNPNKLFRRIRDEFGVLRLSKAAKAYHPGRGVYRSSYKNALRFARNETIFAYEASNLEKRQELDFVVGIEIKVSPEHNPADDAGGVSCIALQGKYPKNFDWTYKWHVSCKCVSLDVLKDKDELMEDVDSILDGGEPNSFSKNTVTTLPNSYTQYVKDNDGKWMKSGKYPWTFGKNKGKFSMDISLGDDWEKRFEDYADFGNIEEDYYKAYYKAYYSQQEKRILNGLEQKGQMSHQTSSVSWEAIEEGFDIGMERAVDAYKWKNCQFITYNNEGTGVYRVLRDYLTTPEDVFINNPLYQMEGIALKELDAYIKKIDEFIDAFRLEQDMVLYRRVHGPLEKFMKGLKEGDVFEDLTYSSTAIVPQPYFGQYQIKIYAKEGSKVSNVFNGSEMEYLVGRKAKYKVISVNTSEKATQALFRNPERGSETHIVLELISE